MLYTKVIYNNHFVYIEIYLLNFSSVVISFRVTVSPKHVVMQNNRDSSYICITIICKLVISGYSKPGIRHFVTFSCYSEESAKEWLWYIYLMCKDRLSALFYKFLYVLMYEMCRKHLCVRIQIKCIKFILCGQMNSIQLYP